MSTVTYTDDQLINELRRFKTDLQEMLRRLEQVEIADDEAECQAEMDRVQLNAIQRQLESMAGGQLHPDISNNDVVSTLMTEIGSLSGQVQTLSGEVQTLKESNQTMSEQMSGLSEKLIQGTSKLLDSVSEQINNKIDKSASELKADLIETIQNQINVLPTKADFDELRNTLTEEHFREWITAATNQIPDKEYIDKKFTSLKGHITRKKGVSAKDLAPIKTELAKLLQCTEHFEDIKTGINTIMRQMKNADNTQVYKQLDKIAGAMNKVNGQALTAAIQKALQDQPTQQPNTITIDDSVLSLLQQIKNPVQNAEQQTKNRRQIIIKINQGVASVVQNLSGVRKKQNEIKRSKKKITRKNSRFVRKERRLELVSFRYSRQLSNHLTQLGKHIADFESLITSHRDEEGSSYADAIHNNVDAVAKSFQTIKLRLDKLKKEKIMQYKLAQSPPDSWQKERDKGATLVAAVRVFQEELSIVENFQNLFGKLYEVLYDIESYSRKYEVEAKRNGKDPNRDKSAAKRYQVQCKDLSKTFMSGVAQLRKMMESLNALQQKEVHIIQDEQKLATSAQK